MLIIGDARLPDAAKEKLSATGTFVPLATRRIVYDAISGHPDIFMCQGDENLVVAPNLPSDIFRMLQMSGVRFIKGKTPVGKRYPQTAVYNAVVTQKFLIHHPEISDISLREIFRKKKYIAVKQGYTRCNLLALKDDVFVTSDHGIFKTLKKEGLEVHYFSPEGILLPGFSHGFLGGCLGILKNRIFVTGSLSYYPEGKKLKQLFNRTGYDTEELYNGPLFDGGGLFFINPAEIK